MHFIFYEKKYTLKCMEANNYQSQFNQKEQYLMEKISHQQKIIDNLRDQISRLQNRETISNGALVDRDDYFDENQIGFIEAVSKQELILMIIDKCKEENIAKVSDNDLELFSVKILKQLYSSEPPVIRKFIKNSNNDDFPCNNIEQQKRKIKAYARKVILKRIFESGAIEYSVRKKFSLLTFTAVKFFEQFPEEIQQKLVEHLRNNKDKVWNKEYVKGFYFIINLLNKSTIEDCFGFLRDIEYNTKEIYQDLLSYILELVGNFVYFVSNGNVRATDGLKDLVLKFEVSDPSMLKGVYGELVFAYMADKVYDWKVLSFQKEFKGIIHKESFCSIEDISVEQSDFIYNILGERGIIDFSSGAIIFAGSFTGWKAPRLIRDSFDVKKVRKIRGILKMVKKSSQGEIDLICLDQEDCLWDVEIKNWAAGSIIRCEKFLKEISRQLNSNERNIFLKEFCNKYFAKTGIKINGIKKMAVLDCDTPFSKYLEDVREFEGITVKLFDLTPRKLTEEIFLKTQT